MTTALADAVRMFDDIETSTVLKWPILLDTALKGSVLVAISVVVVACSRRRAAATRHVVWTAALVAHLVLPVITVLAPAVYAPVLPTPLWVDATPGSTRWVVLTLCTLVWLAVGVMGMIQLGVGSWRAAALARRATRIRDPEWLGLMGTLATGLGIHRSVDLRCSSHYLVPVTAGILRPTIVLPVDATTWHPDRRAFVLAHELAHVRRFDTLTQLLAQVAVVVFWFDPFVWVAARRMRVEREHACDDAVLSSGSVPWEYALELIRIVQRTVTLPSEALATPLVGLAMGRVRGELHTRVDAILDSTRDRRPLRGFDVVIAALVVAMLTVPLGALRPFRDAHRVSTSDTHFPVRLHGRP